MAKKGQKKNEKEQKFDIPVEGSMGLLALGAAGLKAWRKVRDQAKKEEKDKKE